jgi:hypothetical protein
MAAKDSDLAIICDLDTQLKEYKCKYERAKMEFRGVKGKFSKILSLWTIVADLQLYSDPSTILTSSHTRRPAPYLARY